MEYIDKNFEMADELMLPKVFDPEVHIKQREIKGHFELICKEVIHAIQQKKWELKLEYLEGIKKLKCTHCAKINNRLFYPIDLERFLYRCRVNMGSNLLHDVVYDEQLAKLFKRKIEVL
jgi:hypothetical protein